MIGLPPGNCITVTGAVEHMFMMDFASVQAELARVLGLPSMAVALQPGLLAPEPVASSEAVHDLLRKLHAERPKGALGLAEDVVRLVLHEFRPGALRGVARRILKDIMKAPPA